MKPSVFVQEDWARPSIELFSRYGYPIVTAPELADIVVFNGGEDLHPSLYGQTIHPHAHVNWLDQARDERELRCYEKAKKAFKFGICRGGQLLNVMNGGKLWQHVSDHNHAHYMIDMETDEAIWTSSVHHQQFILGPHVTVVATAQESSLKIGFNCNPRSRNKGKELEWYRGEGDTRYNDDPEVVYYERDKALCIQGHPEYPGYTRFTDYSMALVERFMA